MTETGKKVPSENLGLEQISNIRLSSLKHRGSPKSFTIQLNDHRQVLKLDVPDKSFIYSFHIKWTKCNPNYV